MAVTRKALLESALTLEPNERAHLANDLLASLDDTEDNVEEAWAEELVRRARAVREGRAELVDGPASLRAIRERLQGL